MKLHESIKQLTSKFGQEVLAEKRLANLVADLNGYEDCPAMKHVFRGLVKEGYAQKLFAAYESDPADAKAKAEDMAKDFAKSANFKLDLVTYGFDSLLYSLNCLESIKEPVSRGFDPTSKGDADLLDNLPARLDDLKKQYLDLLDKLIVLPVNAVTDAQAYYTTESLTKLYAIEAQIAAIAQQMGEAATSPWCEKKRNKKLDALHNLQKNEIAKASEDKAKAKKRRTTLLVSIGIAASILVAVMGMIISYSASSDARSQFEETIQRGEECIASGDYKTAFQLFDEAKENYSGFMTSLYQNDAERHKLNNIDRMVAEANSLISQGQLGKAEGILTSVPTDVLQSDSKRSDHVSDAFSLLLNTRRSLFDQLLANISVNNGHLDSEHKKQLDVLLTDYPDDYWLNIMAQRDKDGGRVKKKKASTPTSSSRVELAGAQSVTAEEQSVTPKPEIDLAKEAQALMTNMAANGGKLDAQGKAKFEELIKDYPDDYWLNVIKKKEEQ